MKLKGAAYSKTGKEKVINTDNYCLFDHIKNDSTDNQEIFNSETEKTTTIVTVCDGIGKTEYSEKASELTVKGLKSCSIDETKLESFKQIKEISRIIRDEKSKIKNYCPGTSMASLYIDNGKAISCNIGNCRCYLLRNNELLQLSKDHCEIDETNNRKQLTQHIGKYKDEYLIEPFYSEEIELEINDKFFLCSDGITEILSDDEISEIIKSENTEEEIVNEIINKAFENGGKDNATVVLFSVEQTDEKVITGFLLDFINNKKVLIVSIMLLFVILLLIISNIINSVKINNLNKDKKLIYYAYQQLENKIADKEKNIEELNNLIKENEKEINTLNNNISKKETEIEKLNEKISKRDYVIEELKKIKQGKGDELINSIIEDVLDE